LSQSSPKRAQRLHNARQPVGLKGEPESQLQKLQKVAIKSMPPKVASYRHVAD
jgi:hypothetical protein